MRTNRIIFFGTPEFSVPALRELQNNDFEILMVVTQPDQPSGRGKKLASPAIKRFCDENKLPCMQPKSIKSEKFLNFIREMQPDIMIVAAFGRIFSQDLLDLAPTINIHASLLPRWRGASPISQAILHGDDETGISIMKIVEELDAGPVMLQKRIPIDDNDDTESLTEKLGKLGANALTEALEIIENAEPDFEEQDEANVTFAPVLSVEDAEIDWSKSATQIQQHIRAYSPWPGAYTFDGVERIKIYKANVIEGDSDGSLGTLIREKKKLSVQCSHSLLEIQQVQRPGKTKQEIVDFLNGYPQDRKRWT